MLPLSTGQLTKLSVLYEYMLLFSTISLTLESCQGLCGFCNLDLGLNLTFGTDKIIMGKGV